jgi:hypothetical protein
MTPEDLTPIERRLRDAYADAAATVQERDLNPDAPARPAVASTRPGSARRTLLVSLTAAAAVLLVAIAPLAIAHGPHPGPREHHNAPAGNPTPTPAQTPFRGPVTGPPKYFVTIYGIGSGLLEVRNAVTGVRTATIKIPIAGGYWYALAAQNARTFIASEDVAPSSSYLYRFVIGRHGTVTSISLVRSVRGTVMSASVTPDGRYAGYLLLTSYGKNNHAKVQVMLANLATGKVLASWPIPDSDSIASMSIDADGNALAVSAYTYTNVKSRTTYQNSLKHADLVQWTSVLRPATSGTSIGRLPRLLPQAGMLALSPDGSTLYEFLQAGHVTGSSWRDPRPVTFDLDAVSTSSGEILSVLHTWRAVWAGFMPQLALGPAGGYLLIADSTSLARVSTATGRYTALPGSIPSENAYQKFESGQGGDIDTLAW